MEEIIALIFLLIYVAGVIFLPILILLSLIDDPEDNLKILTFILSVIWIVAYGYNHDNIRKTHTTNNELVLKKDSHYHLKEPTYIILSTVDDKKYTSINRESMKQVENLIFSKRIDKTEIKNNILQIYYSNGKRVDIEIKQLDDYYKK